MNGPGAAASYGDLLVTSLVVLVGVCIAAFVVVKLAGRFLATGRTRGAHLLDVIARLPLEPRRSLYVVSVADKTLLVGTSEMGLSVLSELDGAEVRSRAVPTTSFGDMVMQALGRRRTTDVPAGTREITPEGLRAEREDRVRAVKQEISDRVAVAVKSESAHVGAEKSEQRVQAESAKSDQGAHVGVAKSDERVQADSAKPDRSVYMDAEKSDGSAHVGVVKSDQSVHVDAEKSDGSAHVGVVKSDQSVHVDAEKLDRSAHVGAVTSDESAHVSAVKRDDA